MKIDIQTIFKENILDYVEDSNISDDDFTIQAIYEVIKDGYVKQIEDNCHWFSKEYYEHIKHFKKVDIVIGKELVKNIKIEKNYIDSNIDIMS